MAKDYKFGTFAGVFTPSILTILGVIMYMRLGYVVGHAGLVWAIGIILMSHVISIPTGLSVSSISTDKKVKAGGVYYIISRSLGLSIGGALGIALYIGMGFSIALYIIGFCESFNPTIGLPVTPTTLRIVGTIVLLAITTLAFISTSLALKSQFFILTAIIVSLVAIVFGSHDFVPKSSSIWPFPGDETTDPRSLGELFGIFFPAVTGFTAGVSMSGDLKDPRRAIPVGTIASIGVGLIVYVALAIFIALTVDGDALRTDRNIMEKIAFYAPFVMAGIWGATLSSAMGSILGAPRILQALSVDKITPKIFGIGYGPGNEPRNALIFTAAIAEMAIMIGELDVIARIVTMFYLTTYGFLNLTCAIETWASPDFRPDFRIPNWVSLIGAGASFFLMIWLDPGAMIGATLIMIGIFAYLKRQELGADSDDIWDGFWAALVRTGLFKLNKERIQKRNWRPNVILFSGGSKARPHLMNFGRWLVGNRGLLSDFELVENHASTEPFPKAKQSLPNSERYPGIFTRRQACRDIYEGMEIVIRGYGFSGMEPNTVMTGWARQTRDDKRFADIVRKMAELDYNILMLDYDERYGFGERKQIDIWWRGAGNNVSLALMLSKFVLQSDDWRQAKLRVLIMNDDNIETEKIHTNMNHVLEDARMTATVKVINNSIEQRSFLEIIRLESASADLILLGLPTVTHDNAAQFIDNMNRLLTEIGTVLLTRASSYFEEIYVGIEKKIPATMRERETPIPEDERLPALRMPQVEVLTKTIEKIRDELDSWTLQYFQEYFEMVYEIHTRLLLALWQHALHHFKRLENYPESTKPERFRRALDRFQADFLQHAHKVLSIFKNDELVLQCEMMEEGTVWLHKRVQRLAESGPNSLTVFFEADQLILNSRESLPLTVFKLKNRLKAHLTGKSVGVRIPFRTVMNYHIEYLAIEMMDQQLRRFGHTSYQFMTDLQKFINQTILSLNRLHNMAYQGRFDRETMISEKNELAAAVSELQIHHTAQSKAHRQRLRKEARELLQTLIDSIEEPEIYEAIKEQEQRLQEVPRRTDELLHTSERWYRNQVYFINFLEVDLHLMALQQRLRHAVRRLKQSVQRYINEEIVPYLESLESQLPTLTRDLINRQAAKLRLSPDAADSFDEQIYVQAIMHDIHNAVNKLPEGLEILTEAAINQLGEQQFETEVETRVVPVRRLIDRIIRTEFVDSVQELMIKQGFAMKKTRTSVQETMRLTLFNLTNVRSNDELGDQERTSNFEQIIENGLNRIGAERDRLHEHHTDWRKALDKSLVDLIEKLNPHAIARHPIEEDASGTARDLGEMLTRVEPRQARLVSRLGNKIRQIRPGGSASNGQVTEADSNEVAAVLNMLEALMPRPEVMESLPFYYRQLFSEKAHINTEFWVGREPELHRAEQVVSRFRQGIPGGLMVTGDPLSGKSSLAHQIATRHFEEKRLFIIEPPLAGSVDPATFSETMEDVTGISGSLENIVNALPRQSVLIFDDLELWWERSDSGQAVIAQIIDLMNRLGDKALVITAINRFSQTFINRLFNLRQNFLDVIVCQPLRADQVKRAVLSRHRTTGLTFQMNGQSQGDISDWQLDRWFARLTDAARGNIGQALHLWLTTTETLTKHTLHLRSPRLPDLTPLHQLELDWVVMLIQLLLHKKLTRPRLLHLMQQEDSRSDAVLMGLKRSGLIVDEGHGIFEIHPSVKVYLIEALQQNGYL